MCVCVVSILCKVAPVHINFLIANPIHTISFYRRTIADLIAVLSARRCADFKIGQILGACYWFNLNRSVSLWKHRGKVESV